MRCMPGSAVSVLFFLTLSDHCLLIGCNGIGESFMRSASTLRLDASRKLRRDAIHLAHALRSELGPLHPERLLVARARDRLRQDASRFDQAQGVDSQRLLRYADLAPARLLVLPADIVPVPAAYARPREDLHVTPEAFDLVGVDSDDSTAPQDSFASTVSEQTVMQRDADGHMVQRTTRCKNGVCVQKTETGKEPRDRLGKTSGSGQSLSSSEGGVSSTSRRDRRFLDATSSSVEDTVKRMANDMQSIEQRFGAPAFDSIFDHAFGNSYDQRTSSGDGALEHEEPNGASAVASTSSSTETVIKDGRVVQRTQKCKNGKCVTSQNERVLQQPPATGSGQPQEARSGDTNAMVPL